MKVSFSSIVYTLFSRFILCLFALVMVIPVFILVFIVPQRYRYNRVYFYCAQCMYRVIMRASLLSISIVGREHLPSDPAIYVANHSSSLDIPMLGLLVGSKSHLWIATNWLTRFYIFKFFLPRVALLVDMETSTNSHSVRSLIKALKMIKQKSMSVMIFPEGGRYTDGTVHNFYAGFVLLARKTGLPIVPVRMFNLQKVYPPNTFWINYCPVKVVIGEPITINEGETDQACRDRVYEWFLSQE